MTKHLKSILELDQLYSVLISESHEHNWCIRDSEYDGRYIKGLTKDENKIRIVEEDQVFNI